MPALLHPDQLQAYVRSARRIGQTAAIVVTEDAIWGFIPAPENLAEAMRPYGGEEWRGSDEA